MTLGEKIRNLRNNNNISQDKLAKMLNINRNNLSRIETDKSVPTSIKLKKTIYKKKKKYPK